MIHAIEALPGKKTWPELSSRKSCKPRKKLLSIVVKGLYIKVKVEHLGVVP